MESEKAGRGETQRSESVSLSASLPKLQTGVSQKGAELEKSCKLTKCLKFYADHFGS